MSALIPAPQPGGGEFLLYQSEDGRTKLDVRLVEQTVWLSQKQLTELFGKAKGTISEHIKHIFEDQELEPGATVRLFRTVQTEGAREVGREVEHYNLDMVLALGFRVRSPAAVRFRQWADRQGNGAIPGPLCSWQTFRLRARSCPSIFLQLGTASWPRIKTPPKR